MPPHNASSWKKLASDLAPDGVFGQPASEDRISAVEMDLGIRLPSPLREFLGEANGLIADYGSRVVWSTSDITGRNREFRASEDFRRLYMSFSTLLFFGDDVGEDQYALAIQADGHIHKRDIYRWDHETDSRLWFAARLEQYLEKRLKPRDEE